MEICTCHISNLSCKNQKCRLLIVARECFKKEVSNILINIMTRLFQQEFSKKESIRALRRELKHLNKLNLDLFDETANLVWRAEKE